jgi:UDP-2-acetamido-3-amino-2,3-dideoxy-glucuronate N-acetyltransferase
MPKTANQPPAPDEIQVHPSAHVDKSAKIGGNTKIWHFCHIMPGAKIGRNCVIGQNCFIAERAVMGNNVKLQNNVSVYDLVTLEDNVFVGPSAVFTNDKNPRAAFPKNGKWIPTLVKKGATIGANATILCGITIGASAFIGAGSLVSKDIPDYAIAIGLPARIMGWMCACGKKLKFIKNSAQCPCGRKYEKDNLTVKQT